jgi:hypothetical protein
MNKRFRTQIACRIAHIDRVRFNEAVAAGNYPCAPKTERGSSRVFDESQLIALFYYGRLLDQGWPPKLAGSFACRLSEELYFHPDAEEILLIFDVAGGCEYWPGDSVKEMPRKAQGNFVLHRLSIDIGNIREIIRKEIAEELSIYGDDDESNA